MTGNIIHRQRHFQRFLLKLGGR
ncbi:hypothetical protein CY0110_16712 [Crocosphaera chwakensis CCY0110]|uniref:Uncharacterized protein n=1 Tax=Crocosphaera chwakensis CCY0110 TaxID=391612 RepID=A3II24_9CHRO|nr:hypothetical protein CY0110_16712 [Crocosphaera chwakensis CCY0110]